MGDAGGEARQGLLSNSDHVLQDGDIDQEQTARSRGETRLAANWARDRDHVTMLEGYAEDEEGTMDGHHDRDR